MGVGLVVSTVVVLPGVGAGVGGSVVVVTPGTVGNGVGGLVGVLGLGTTLDPQTWAWALK